ncbi:MAG: NUDIX hydrolase [Candidatus Micrarchaeota archaeon]
MRERKLAKAPEYSALACAIIEDGGRVLFLKRVEGERELLELPCALVEKGRNPVAELKEWMLRKTAIDAQVQEPVMEGKYNAGSRKKRKWIPALGFRASAKNLSARVSGEYSGVKWISLEEAKKERLGRFGRRPVVWR